MAIGQEDAVEGEILDEGQGVGYIDDEVEHHQQQSKEKEDVTIGVV